MPFSINETDSVHIYSDTQHIWLQLRRHHPTQQDIDSPSFKTAIRLTPAQAIDIARELFAASTQRQAVKPLETNGARNNNPANHGKPWTPEEEQKLVAAFDAQTSIPELAKTLQRGIGGIQSRLAKLGKMTVDQYKTYPPESQ